MRIIGTTLVLIFNILICKAQIIDMEALKKDSNFMAYKKITATIMYQMKSKYITFPPNSTDLQAMITMSGSTENLKKNLKASGVTHSDEFVDEVVKQRELMANFRRKHPEVDKLSPEQRRELISSTLPTN